MQRCKIQLRKSIDINQVQNISNNIKSNYIYKDFVLIVQKIILTSVHHLSLIFNITDVLENKSEANVPPL